VVIFGAFGAAGPGDYSESDWVVKTTDDSDWTSGEKDDSDWLAGPGPVWPLYKCLQNC
jgi:hypothetical protein